MKRDVMRKWVKALRSGKYKQTLHNLKCNRNNSYCCLGVLTQLKANKMKKGFDSISRDNGQLCPSSVMEWAGLKTDNGCFKKDGIYTALATLNDSGKSFKEIADVIEENWKKL